MASQLIIDHQASLLGICWVGTAIVGAGVASPLVDWTHAYKTFMVGTIFAVAAAMLGFTLLLYFSPREFVAVYLVGGAMGLGASGIPAIIEAAIECTFPVPEGTVMGLLFLGFNVTSIVFTYAISHITFETSSMASAEIDTRYIWSLLTHSANWVVFASYAIACVFAVLFKPDYRRLAYEKKRKDEDAQKNRSSINIPHE